MPPPMDREQHKIPKCVLCDGSHWAQSCDEYRSNKQRRKRLANLGRCFRCFRKGHEKPDCKFTIACYGCGLTSHHTALCPKAKLEPAENDLGVVMVCQTPVSAGNLSPSARSAKSNETTHSSKLSTLTSLLATQARVANFLNHERQHDVVIVFDKTSPLSYIVSGLASSLELDDVGEQKPTITFATTKQVKYEIDIRLLDGSWKTLIAYQKDQLAEAPVITDVNCVADPATTQKQWCITSRIVKPSLVIGKNDIGSFEVAEIDRLKSGLVVYESMLGYMSSGNLKRLHDYANDPQVHSISRCLPVPKTEPDPAPAAESQVSRVNRKRRTVSDRNRRRKQQKRSTEQSGQQDSSANGSSPRSGLAGRVLFIGITLCLIFPSATCKDSRFVLRHNEFSLTQTFSSDLSHFDQAIDQKGKPTPIGSKLLVSYQKEWNFPVSLRRLDDAVNDTVPPSPPPPLTPAKIRNDRDHGRMKKQKRSTDDHLFGGQCRERRESLLNLLYYPRFPTLRLTP